MYVDPSGLKSKQAINKIVKFDKVGKKYSSLTYSEVIVESLKDFKGDGQFNLKNALLDDVDYECENGNCSGYIKNSNGNKIYLADIGNVLYGYALQKANVSNGTTYGGAYGATMLNISKGEGEVRIYNFHYDIMKNEYPDRISYDKGAYLANNTSEITYDTINSMDTLSKLRVDTEKNVDSYIGGLDFTNILNRTNKAY